MVTTIFLQKQKKNLFIKLIQILLYTHLCTRHILLYKVIFCYINVPTVGDEMDYGEINTIKHSPTLTAIKKKTVKLYIVHPINNNKEKQFFYHL